MATRPKVTAKEDIGTPTQNFIDGLLDGAEDISKNCIDAIKYLDDKIAEAIKLKDEMIEKIKKYAGDKKDELIAECKEKMKAAVKKLKEVADKVLAKLKEWKDALDAKVNELGVDKIKEKYLSQYSYIEKIYTQLWNDGKGPDLPTDPTELAKKLKEYILMIIEPFVEPYKKCLELVEWWTTDDEGGRPMVTYVGECAKDVGTAITEAENIVKTIDTIAEFVV